MGYSEDLEFIGGTRKIIGNDCEYQDLLKTGSLYNTISGI